MKKWLSVYVFPSDWTVFGVSITCLLWIICYKFWLINDDFFYPFWENADIAGDIIYSVFTSIFAAGVFYIFTILIARNSKIRGLKDMIAAYTKDIDQLSNSIIINITNNKTNTNYTFDEFVKTLNTDIDSAQNDFIIFYSNLVDTTNFNNTLNYQMYYLNNIMATYSDTLPDNLIIPMREHKNFSFKTLQLFSNLKDKSAYEQFFLAFNLNISASRMLRDSYNIK